MSKVFFRPTIFFVIASIVTFTLHELSHAVTAKLFGIPATLFAFYANISRTTGTFAEHAIISAVGPSASLIIGVACLLAFRRVRYPALNLFLLYNGMLSTSVFLGNLFSSSRVGDFHQALVLLGCSSIVMQAMTWLGLVMLLLFMYRMGKHFLSFRFSEQQAKTDIISLLVVPWLLGTALTIIIYYPLPSSLTGGLIASSMFWIPSIIGAWKSDTTIQPIHALTGITSADLIVLVCFIVLVRVLQTGVSF